MPALRWFMSQTIHQCFVCMIDKYKGKREHSIFVIIATLINVCNESNDIREEAPNCISILKQATDKHAPIKKASQSKRRQLAKPWFTKGLLT